MSREVYDPQNILTLTAIVRFAPKGESGAIRLGACVMHKLTPQVEDKTVYWPTRSGRQAVAKKNTVKADLSWEIQLIEHTKENDAVLLFGEVGADYTQAAGTEQSATINAVQLRREYPLGKYDVTNVSVKVATVAKIVGTQDEQGTVTPADADVILDAALGTIYVRDGGTITAGDNLTVTFDCPQVSRDTITPLTTMQREGTLYLAEFDPGTTDVIRDHVFDCILTPKDWGDNTSGGDNNKFSLVALATTIPVVTTRK